MGEMQREEVRLQRAGDEELWWTRAESDDVFCDSPGDKMPKLEPAQSPITAGVHAGHNAQALPSQGPRE